MRPHSKEFDQKILQLPYRGAPSTVGVIRDAALRSQDYYNVRELGEYILKNTQAKDYISEPLAILYFVCSHTKYARDPRTVELIRAPYLVADRIMKGEKPLVDCDDMTALINSLTLAMGSASRCVTLAFKNQFYKNQRQYSHVCAQALDPRSGSWITLDPVAGPKTKEMLNRAVAAKIWRIA